MKIILQVRDLHDGSPSQQPFDTVEEATAWLKERPRFKSVIGVANSDIDPEVDGQLRAALRPLDADEQAAERVVDEKLKHELVKRNQAMLRMQQEAMAREATKPKNNDPNRLMMLRWTYKTELAVVEPGDDRSISDEVREAAMAWIAERNTWVEGRGQMVGDASLQVWPGPLPDGSVDRVEYGTFIPVTAAKKENS
jgi:hypothetical protein